MSIISPADLEASPLADLHALASALGIDGFRRLRKDELADAILARQGADAPRRPRAGSRRAATEQSAEAEATEETDATPPVRPTPSTPPPSCRPICIQPGQPPGTAGNTKAPVVRLLRNCV